MHSFDHRAGALSRCPAFTPEDAVRDDSDDIQAMIPAYVDGVLQPCEKLAVHRRGLKHLAVSVFVLRGDEILIQRRALGKYHTPGLWANTCCTHPHWGEDARDCAVRRLGDELGLTGVDPEFRQEVEYRAAVGADMVEHEIVSIFVAKASGPVALTPNLAEVMDTHWITLTDLRRAVDKTPEEYTPWLRIYLAEHSAAIFG